MGMGWRVSGNPLLLIFLFSSIIIIDIN